MIRIDEIKLGLYIKMEPGCLAVFQTELLPGWQEMVWTPEESLVDAEAQVLEVKKWVDIIALEFLGPVDSARAVMTLLSRIHWWWCDVQHEVPALKDTKLTIERTHTGVLGTPLRRQRAWKRIVTEAQVRELKAMKKRLKKFRQAVRTTGAGVAIEQKLRELRPRRQFWPAGEAT